MENIQSELWKKKPWYTDWDQMERTGNRLNIACDRRSQNPCFDGQLSVAVHC